MKKLYLGLITLLCVLMCVHHASAQISLTATAGTSPATYTSLKAAFDAINNGTHQGNVSITVNANTTETLQPTLNRSGSGSASYSSVLIKPAASTTPTISGSIPGALINLSGASNVTIDGANTSGGTTKNLTITNNNTAGAAVRFIDGASNNVLKNCVLKGGSSTINTTGVVFMATAATAATGNNNNLIENNDITKSAASPQVGILNSGTSGKPNTGNIYRNNRIFDFSAIGFCDGDGTFGFSNNTLVEGNEIFLTSAQTGIVMGIYIEHITGIVNMVISKNYIHDLTSSNDVYGIDLYEVASATVVNNMIALSSSGSPTIIGIAQEARLGAVIKIHYNTVSIYGTAASGFSTAFGKTYLSTNDDIRNNIFSNTRQVSGGTSGQFAYAQGDAGTIVSNYNNLVSSGNTLNVVATDDNGVYATLSNWQTATGQDANSISVVPVFTSATNLHLTPANSLIDNKGTAIAGVTTDFDNQTRSATTPDIGADEFTATPPPTNDLAVTAIVVPANGASYPAGGTVAVQATVNNLGGSAQTNAQIQLTITGPGGYNYTNTQTIASIASAANATVNFAASTAFTTPGTYTVTVTSLLADNNAANNTQTVTFTVANPLSGTYTVGSGGNYTSLTNPGGIFSALNSLGASANITINIISDLGAESGSVPLNQLTGGFTVLIKPSLATRKITGTGTGGAVIAFNGADNVTLDGSLSGGSDRSLTIENPNTASGTTVLFVASPGAAAGANNNTIKNCIIIAGTKGTGSSPTIPATVTTFGIFAGSASGGLGVADNDNLTIEGNLIQKATIGIAAAGGAGPALMDNLIIRNNVIGDALNDANSIGRTGIFVPYVNTATIVTNRIQNVNVSDEGNATGLLIGPFAENVLVTRNQITGIRYLGNQGYGGKGIDVLASYNNSNITLANNMISDIKGDGWSSLADDGITGIRIASSGAGAGDVKVYHNSIHLGSGSFAGNASGTVSAALYIGSTAALLDIRNNTFSTNLVNTNAATAKTYAIYSAAPNTAFSNLNYNNYFASGSQGVAGFIGSDRADLTAIQAGFGSNANSKNVQPVFVSATDLHLVTGSNAGLEDQGGALPAVTVDFDNDPRSATTPDIGADEVASACVAPTITTAPTAVSGCAGTAANLTVVASGTSLTYQWRKGGVNIVGATSATLNFAALTASDAGSYEVVVANGCGTVTSVAVTITVQTAPSITTQPTNQTACTGSSVNFSVVANGANLTYQWRKAGVNIAGATSVTYTIASVVAGDAGNYDVVISGSCTPSVTSNAVSLTISSSTTIATQPTNQAACVGGTVTFNVIASGGGLSYQWRKGGTNIAGATSASYSIASVTAGDAGNYDVVVSSSCGGSVTSSTVTLTIGAATSITTQPVAQTVCAGSPVSFTVSATGSGTITYQWRKSGVNISGATGATYTIATTSAANAGSYDVVVSGSCGTVNSVPVSLTVNNLPVANFSSSQGSCGSLTVNFTNSSTIAGGGALTYNWSFGDGNTSTATSPSHTYVAAGNYNVLLVAISSNGCRDTVTQVISVSAAAGNTWLGTTSSNWATASNWCGGIPTAITDITINAGAPNMPVISSTADIRNLTISTGASVTVASGGRLNIHGNFVNTGTLTASAGTVAFQGASNQSVASINAATVIMNSAGGITLTGPMTAATLTLTNGNITLGSHALNLGSSSIGLTNSHIITNGTGVVNATNITLTPMVFPVAPNASSYNPVTITNGGGRNYAVSVATGISPVAINNNARAVNRTWTIVPNSTPGVLVNISLQYADADANASCTPTAIMEAGVYGGGRWGIANAGAGITPTGNSTARIASLNTSVFGPTVLANVGGLNYPTASANLSADVASAQLLPNVTNGQSVLRIAALRSFNAAWIITDGRGRRVGQRNIRVNAGQNDTPFDFTNLASGIYYLHGRMSDGKTISLKFTKL
jgi:trimeric autotransporter adhesin